MIKRIAGFLLKAFRVEEKVEKEHLEICQYGMEILISTCFSILSVMIIGTVGKAWLESFFFLICFSFLRKQTGGYHAGSYFTCNLSLIICYSSLLYIYQATVRGFGWTELTVIFFIHFTVWYFFMPVENENKPLTTSQRRKAKKYSLCISAVYAILSGLCLVKRFPQGLMLTYTVMLIDVLALVSVMKRRLFYYERKKSNQ